MLLGLQVEEERYKVLNSLNRSPIPDFTMLRLPSRITQRAGGNVPTVGVAELQPAGPFRQDNLPHAAEALEAGEGRLRSKPPQVEQAEQVAGADKVLRSNLRRNYTTLARQPLEGLDEGDIIGDIARLRGPHAKPMLAGQAARSRKKLLLGRLQVDAAKRSIDHENPFPQRRIKVEPKLVRKSIPALLTKIMAGERDASTGGKNDGRKKPSQSSGLRRSRPERSGRRETPAKLNLEDIAVAQLLENGRVANMITTLGLLDEGQKIVSKSSPIRTGGVPEGGNEAYRIACALCRIPPDPRIMDQDGTRHFDYSRPPRGGKRASATVAAFLRWRVLDKELAEPTAGSFAGDKDGEEYAWGEVGLSRNRLCNVGLPLVLTALEGNGGAVRSLNLSGNPLLGGLATERLAAALIAPAGALSRLRVLDLKACHFGDDGLGALAPSLATTQIECLRLADNSLTAGCTDALCLLLEGSRHLSRLDLSWNDISSHGRHVHSVGKLVEAVGRSSFSLSFLSLSVNPLGDKDGSSLLEALARSGSLQELEMQQCGLGAQAEARLTRALDDHVQAKGGSSLRVLNLNDNDLTMGEQLVRAAASHPTLEALGLKAGGAEKIGGGGRRSRSLKLPGLGAQHPGGQAWRHPPPRREEGQGSTGPVVEVSEEAQAVLDVRPSYDLSVDNEIVGKSSIFVVKAKARHQGKLITHTQVVE